MKKIKVTASRNYTVHIGSGILPELGLLLRAQVPGERVCIVTDDTVQALYGAQAEASLTQAGFAVYMFAFPMGSSPNAPRRI